jgi:hypothetical protein
MLEWIFGTIGGALFILSLKWCWKIGKLIIWFRRGTPEQRLFLKIILHTALLTFLTSLVKEGVIKGGNPAKIRKWERQTASTAGPGWTIPVMKTD